MTKFRRPKTPTELDILEVKGLWRAIALSRTVAEGTDRISIETIQRIHRVIFENAQPEIAGRFRRDGEDVQQLECVEPPPGRLVAERMQAFWREFDTRISSMKKIRFMPDEETERWLDSVMELAAWTQHQITYIHPFCNGNGRMARIMTNIVLIRFGLPPSLVKIEAENKDSYLKGLCQIDAHFDYEPLKKIILEGAYDTLEKEERQRLNAKKG